MSYIDWVVNTIPFVIYTVLLIKLESVWRHLNRAGNSDKAKRLIAVVAILAICTVLFMSANAYALFALGSTLLSMKFFQMFVVGNCVAYWMVLDLVAWEAEHDVGE